MRLGEDVDDIYSELGGASHADSFPEKFDLRQRGVVTPVKFQNPFGTCWSFGTIAASESSLLSNMGLTAEAFAGQYGEEMNLSEKHLAYFTGTVLPSASVYPEGECPFPPDQAGEGVHILEGVDVSVYDMGGNYYLATSSLGEKAPEAYAELHADEDKKLMRYCVGVVNPGENYVSFEEDRWIDWRDAIDSFAANGDCAYMAYDNLPIKGYVYPLEQVKQAHDLDVWVPSAGGAVAICPECGYVLESCD